MGELPHAQPGFGSRKSTEKQDQTENSDVRTSAARFQANDGCEWINGRIQPGSGTRKPTESKATLAAHSNVPRPRW